MRIFWLPFVVVILLVFFLDWIISSKLWKTGKRYARVLSVLNVVATVGTMATVFVMLGTQPTSKSLFVGHMATTARALLAFMLVLIPKLLWGVFYGLGCIKWLRDDFKTMLKSAGMGVGIITFIVMLLGSVSTPYKVAVTRVDLDYSALPAAFDGYRIVHISDAHLGAYAGDTSFFARCVDSINSLNPDAVCFTGDLVSMTAEEAKPFVGLMSRIKARDGVYSILGNHDYAEYMRMLTDEEKEADVKELCAMQNRAGWTLLDNSSTLVKRSSDSIAIVGTANYGDPPFPVYGDYGVATQGLKGVFKVHLQHNPYMWRKVLVGKEEAPLTLSGHTHAMQFVFNMFGQRWSPASWRYPEWGGLYSEGEQKLYVNTGLGMAGPPFRIGILPEITLITLHRKK